MIHDACTVYDSDLMSSSTRWLLPISPLCSQLCYLPWLHKTTNAHAFCFLMKTSSSEQPAAFSMSRHPPALLALSSSESSTRAQCQSTAWIPSTLSVSVRHALTFPEPCSPLQGRRTGLFTRIGKGINTTTIKTKTIPTITCKTPRPGKSPNNEAYNQFAELLNKTQSLASSSSSAEPSSKSSDEPETVSNGDANLKDKYAAFSQHIGDVPESKAEKEMRIAKEYSQFDRYLGADKNNDQEEDDQISIPTVKQPQPSASSAKTQQQYAEFSKRLGLNNSKTDELKSTNRPPDALSADTNPSPVQQPPLPRDVQPKQSSPETYSKFEALLKKSGGSGRKPVKGSKRWANTLSSTPSSSSPVSTPRGSPESNDAPDNPSNSNVDDNSSSASSASLRPAPTRPKFSAADASRGYAFLEKEFGTGLHRTAANTSDSNTATPTKLVQPPTRPSDLAASQARRDIMTYTYDEDDMQIPSAEMEAEPTATLQPKPVMPGTPNTTKEEAEANSTKENKDIDSKLEMKAAPSPVSSPPVAPPPPLQPKPARPQAIVEPPGVVEKNSDSASSDGKSANPVSVDESNVDEADASSTVILTSESLNEGSVVTPESLNEDSSNTVAANVPELDLSPAETETTKEKDDLKSTIISIPTDVGTAQGTPVLEEKPLRPGTFSIDEDNVSQKTEQVANALETSDGDGYSFAVVREDEEAKENPIEQAATVQLVDKPAYRNGARLHTRSKQQSFVRGTRKTWDELEAVVLEHPKFIEPTSTTP